MLNGDSIATKNIKIGLLYQPELILQKKVTKIFNCKYYKQKNLLNEITLDLCQGW